MAWQWYILRAIQSMEDRIIEHILRQPGFHRAVGRIHRTIHERKYGRTEPAQGEATADPSGSSFLKHFRDEISNQFRGKPTDVGPKK
ncbi:unnamed protein product [Clonostachys rosea]|uniref:Uncharacterized protein n=1 Tax=Bionectria ochroleuca TaxID=29856 RepID=A0ABY6TYI7_BIOOC|nr:unnamed protein product [Clonostachys rosea]